MSEFATHEEYPAAVVPSSGIAQLDVLAVPAHHGPRVIQKATQKARNVLGGELATCSRKPLTGFLRTGCCETGPEDVGVHTVCVQTTAEFLEFSKARGNDLSTPAPQHGFAGLKPGDRWCLCAARWREAYEAGAAPLVDLAATHEATLDYVPLEVLRQHALPRPKA